MILWMRFGLDNSLDLVLEEVLVTSRETLLLCCIMEPPLSSKAVVLTGSAESHYDMRFLRYWSR